MYVEGCRSAYSLASLHAALHEEGGHEGGDDRQDEVADLLGRNVLEDSHNSNILKVTFYSQGKPC